MSDMQLSVSAVHLRWTPFPCTQNKAMDPSKWVTALNKVLGFSVGMPEKLRTPVA